MGMQSGGKVLPDAPAALADQCEEAIEVTHRAGRQIVQHHEAPRLRGDLTERALDPSVGILPVARQRAPQHDGRLPVRKVLDQRPRQQAAVEISTLSIGPEKSPRGALASVLPSRSP